MTALGLDALAFPGREFLEGPAPESRSGRARSEPRRDPRSNFCSSSVSLTKTPDHSVCSRPASFSHGFSQNQALGPNSTQSTVAKFGGVTGMIL